MNEFEEHFRNICETFSPTIEKENGSPKFAASSQADHDLSLCDIGENSLDEGVTAKPVIVKKLKKRPAPQYLKTTAASRAMVTQRPRSPLSSTADVVRNMNSLGAYVS